MLVICHVLYKALHTMCILLGNLNLNHSNLLLPSILDSPFLWEYVRSFSQELITLQRYKVLDVCYMLIQNCQPNVKCTTSFQLLKDLS